MLNKVELCNQLRSDAKYQYMNGELKTVDYIEFILSRIMSDHFKKEKPKETCKWNIIGNLYDFSTEPLYKTDCDNFYQEFEYNKFKYCPYCGKEIEEIES